MNYSVVVPVYNSVEVLEELCERLTKTFHNEVEGQYEIILVDDCSPDPRTWTKVRELAVQFPQVKGIRLTRNFGQQSATLCGIARACGEYVITMDDDCQHRPEDIPALIEKRGHDIVIAQFHRKQHRLTTRFTSWLKGWFDQIVLQKPRHLRLSPFRLLSRTVVDGMLEIRTRNPFIPALMFNVSRDATGVPLTHDMRRDGRTGYTFLKRLRVFTNLLINNSSIPLQAIGLLGTTIATVSFVSGIYLVLQRIAYDYVAPGWTSVMVSVLFIGGLLLFAVGIIGEYLIRIIADLEKPQAYFVREELGFDRQADD